MRELSHLEVVGSIIVMLNKGAKSKLAEGVQAEAELHRDINGAGNDWRITNLLDRGGAPLVNSAGAPWTAAYIDTIVNRRRISVPTSLQSPQLSAAGQCLTVLCTGFFDLALTGQSSSG